jgi:hypothetical protein
MNLAMNDLKSNKSFRVLIGAFVIYCAFRLYQDGWFSRSYDEPEGFGNADLVLAVGAMVVNFLELVGIASIAVISGILPELSKITDWISDQFSSLRDKYKAGKDKDDPAFDWRPLIVILLIYLFISSGRGTALLDGIKRLIGIDNVPTEVSSAIFYLDDDATKDQLAMANSAAVADIFSRSEIERRLYYSDQELGNAESWVQSQIKSANLQSSKLLLTRRDGQVTQYEIPTSLDRYKNIAAN